MSEAVAGWTEERVALLKRLWAEGLSASQIAGQMGGVTRNAVIGKVHRLGLAGRVKPGAPSAPATALPVPRRPRQDRDLPDAVAPAAPEPAILRPKPSFGPLPAAPAAPAAAVALPVSERVTIMELRESMCRWPMGDPTSADFRFCGGRAITGLPYCTHHAQIAYQPATERRRDRRVAGFR